MSKQTRFNLAGSPEWTCLASPKGWTMTHPVGLTAILDWESFTLSIRRGSDGKMLLNEHVNDTTIIDINTMLNNVARDEKSLRQ